MQTVKPKESTKSVDEITPSEAKASCRLMNSVALRFIENAMFLIYCYQCGDTNIEVKDLQK